MKSSLYSKVACYNSTVPAESCFFAPAGAASPPFLPPSALFFPPPPPPPPAPAFCAALAARCASCNAKHIIIHFHGTITKRQSLSFLVETKWNDHTKLNFHFFVFVSFFLKRIDWMLLINKPKENYVKIETWLTCSALLSARSSALDFCGGAPAPTSPCGWPWPEVWPCDLPWSWLGPLGWPWLFCSWPCFWGLFDCCEDDFPVDLGVGFISEDVAVGNLSFSCWICCDCGLLPPDKKHQQIFNTDARAKKSRTHNFVIMTGLLQTFYVNRCIWSYLSSFSSCLLLAVQVAGFLVLDCPPFLLISLIQSLTIIKISI